MRVKTIDPLTRNHKSQIHFNEKWHCFEHHSLLLIAEYKWTQKSLSTNFMPAIPKHHIIRPCSASFVCAVRFHVHCNENIHWGQISRQHSTQSLCGRSLDLESAHVILYVNPMGIYSRYFVKTYVCRFHKRQSLLSRQLGNWELGTSAKPMRHAINHGRWW